MSGNKGEEWNSEQKKVVENFNNHYRSLEERKPDEQYIRWAFFAYRIYRVSRIVNNGERQIRTTCVNKG
jgi:hypothetical protein